MSDAPALAWIALALAAMPAAIGLLNILLLRTPRGTPPAGSLVSILIPARDEAAHIATCITAALAQRGVAVEVLVMDDGSRDETASIVADLAARDRRLRLLRAPPLPPGWTGKIHACACLAEAARGTHLLFIDADVHLAPDAAPAMAGHAARSGAAMVTGVPRQRIGSVGEAMTVPMINLMLVGYLPGGGRAATRHPALAAACGQLLLAESCAYRAAGGHAALGGVLHDALALARRFRRQGLATEVVHAAPLATCRMYRGFAEAWHGFLKNAREGMATPLGLPVWTVLLGGAHLLPWALLPAAPALATIGLGFGIRLLVTQRVREPWWTVPFYPAAVLVALAIQWTALIRAMLGRPARWKGRDYASVVPRAPLQEPARESVR